MSYSITVSSNGKYIIQKVVGNIDRKTAIKYNIEAHTLGKKHGINYYLSDFRECRNTESIVNNYYLAYEDLPNQEIIDLNAFVAVLVAPDDHSHDFVETLFQNSGSNVKLFRDEKAAIDYLLKSHTD